MPPVTTPLDCETLEIDAICQHDVNNEIRTFAFYGTFYIELTEFGLEQVVYTLCTIMYCMMRFAYLFLSLSHNIIVYIVGIPTFHVIRLGRDSPSGRVSQLLRRLHQHKRRRGTNHVHIRGQLLLHVRQLHADR